MSDVSDVSDVSNVSDVSDWLNFWPSFWHTPC